MHSAFAFEVKSVSEAGSFEGLASTYGVKDLGNDVVQLGAFTKTLETKGPERPLLWSHIASEPIGLAKLQDAAEGLILRGQLDLDVQAGRDALSRLRKKIVKGLSIGYSIPAAGAKFIDGVRHLLNIDLHEVSLVVLPMNEGALVTSVKAAELTTIREFEHWLHEAGFSKSRATAIASRGWGAGTTVPEQDPAEAALVGWLQNQIQ